MNQLFSPFISEQKYHHICSALGQNTVCWIIQQFELVELEDSLDRRSKLSLNISYSYDMTHNVDRFQKAAGELRDVWS